MQRRRGRGSRLGAITKFLGGLADKVLGRTTDVPGASQFRTFTGYQSSFSPWDGDVFEQDLTRACIHVGALAASKLKPEVTDAVRSSHYKVWSAFKTHPNRFMGWSQFLYRLKAIYEVDTTAFVVPQLADDGSTVNGLWPLKCDFAEVVEYDDEPWARFHMGSGDVMAIELSKVAVLTKFQYADDFFGGGNAIDQTMELLHAQYQAEKKAIKLGANILYIGKLTGQVKEKDIEDKRDRFAESNLRANSTGLMLYDQTFDSIEQVNHKSYVIDPEEMSRIERHAFNYFGVNEDILQNKYDEYTWDAFYEGNVEPFAIQLADSLNQMLFTVRERRAGNHVSFSSNRLEYMSAASKRNMIRDMLDRGVMTPNEAREILQMPPYAGEYEQFGNTPAPRLDYASSGQLTDAPVADDNAAQDLGGDDQIYGDTDAQNFNQEVDE